MKLQEVLEMLARFGITEEEARHLLTQDNGWQTLQQRVKHVWDAVGEDIYDGVYMVYSRAYDKIQGLKLKSVAKTPEQESRERREVADKFRAQTTKGKNAQRIKDLADTFNMFGGPFGTKL